MHSVRRNVGVRDEDSELDEEDGRGGGGEPGLQQRAQVDTGPRVLVRRQPLSRQETRDDAEHRADESNRAYGPREPDRRCQVQDHQREDAATDAARRARYAGRQTPSPVEPVPNGRDAWVEEH